MTGTYQDLLDRLFEVQDDSCGICGVARSVARLVIDHDHFTGMVRGLLCDACNANEGRHGVCVEWDRCPTCRWRHQPPVSIVGWTCHYVAASRIDSGPQFIPPVIEGQTDGLGRLTVWRPLNDVVKAPYFTAAHVAAIERIGRAIDGDPTPPHGTERPKAVAS